MGAIIMKKIWMRICVLKDSFTVRKVHSHIYY